MVLYVPPISNSILYFFFWFFSFFASLKRSAPLYAFFALLKRSAYAVLAFQDKEKSQISFLKSGAKIQKTGEICKCRFLRMLNCETNRNEKIILENPLEKIGRFFIRALVFFWLSASRSV